MKEPEKKVVFNGKVTFSDNLKGYGFIRRQEGKDVFFLYSDVQEYEGDVELFPGDVVVFQVEETRKGPKAKNIRTASST